MEFKYYLFGFLSAFIVVFVAVVGFYLGKGKTSNALSAETSFSVSPTSFLLPSETPTPAPKPTKGSVTEIIIDALGSKNYELLNTVLASTVEVRIEASECCGTLPRNEVVAQMKYLDKGLSWDFSEEDKIISDIAASLPEHYNNAIVGLAQNRYIAAFQLNQNFEIIKISMASDYRVITRQEE